MPSIPSPQVPAIAPAWVYTVIRDITEWVRRIMRGPSQVQPYLIANLPDATEWDGTTLPVSNGSGSMPTVTAINGVWTYPNGTTV